MEQRVSEKTLQAITDKRQVIIEGHVNCLPSPFTSFTRDFVGLEKPTYLILTSGTKAGKTQFSLHLLFNWLMYAYENQFSTSLHIKYFCLEETDVGIAMRFMSWLLNRLDGIRVSPSALRSTKYALSQDIIDKLNSDQYQRYLEFFDRTIEFSYTAHAMGIFLECKKYCEEVGTVHYKTVSYNDKPVFDHYEANDPHAYNIMVVDHLSLVQEAKGQTKKQAMDQLSELMATELRNKYGMCCYVIQQQSTASDDNESIKLNRTRPSVAGLGDSKYSARDKRYS